MNTSFRILAGIFGFLALIAGGFTLLVAALLLVLPGLCRIEPGSSYGTLLESSGLATLLVGAVLMGLSLPLIKWSTSARQIDKRPTIGPKP